MEWTEGFAIDIKVFGKRSKAPSWSFSRGRRASGFSLV